MDMKNRVLIFPIAFVVALSGLTGCGLAPESTIQANENNTYQVVKTVYSEAPIALSELVDGQDFKVNLVKLSANATSSGSIITVNGAPASITPSGETLLSLSPGANVVTVTNPDGKVRENVTLSFTPPLAVYVTKYFVDVNYSNPVEVWGNVNRPDAFVAVNGIPAFVSVDGSFAAHVQLTLAESDIQAVAVDRDEITEYTIMQSLSRGILTPVYGSDYRFEPHLAPKNMTVALKQGGTAALVLTVMVRTDKGIGPQKCSIIIPGSYPGLTATVSLPEFEGYPNINYHTAMTVTVGPDVAPGQYPLRVEFESSSGSAVAANLNVVVEK
jgi:hypothetical protein